MTLNPLELKIARQAFLDDTVKFYSEDISRRAMDEGQGQKCLYRLFKGETVKKCAIGRHIPDEKYIPAMDAKVSAISDNKLVQEVLPSEILSLGIDFLAGVQRLHDFQGYWIEGGLCFGGQEYIKNIESEFIED